MKGGFCASEVSSACRSGWWMTQNSTSFLCCNLSKTHKPHSWRMRGAHTRIKTHTSSLCSAPPSGRTRLPARTYDELSAPGPSSEGKSSWLRVSVCLVGVRLCLLGWAGELRWCLFWRVAGSEVIRGHQHGGGKWWLTLRELMWAIGHVQDDGWWVFLIDFWHFRLVLI